MRDTTASDEFVEFNWCIGAISVAEPEREGILVLDLTSFVVEITCILLTGLS